MSDQRIWHKLFVYIKCLIKKEKEKEHDNILEQVLNRTREKGVKFIKQKCKFKVSEVKKKWRNTEN